MENSDNISNKNFTDVYRHVGPSQGSNNHNNIRLAVYLKEYSEIYNHLEHLFAECAKNSQNHNFESFCRNLDANNMELFAIRLPVAHSSNSTTFTASEFFDKNFKNFHTSQASTWSQWLSLGVPEAMQPLWTFLHQSMPIGDLETMTIVSADGFVLYSLHGTKAIFTPTEAISASTGSIWQLSRDGRMIVECNPIIPITENEIYSCFGQLFHQHQSAKKGSEVASPEPTTASNKPNSKAKKSQSIVAKPTLAAPTKKSTADTSIIVKKSKLNATSAEDLAMDTDGSDDDDLAMDTDGSDDDKDLSPSCKSADHNQAASDDLAMDVDTPVNTKPTSAAPISKSQPTASNFSDCDSDVELEVLPIPTSHYVIEEDTDPQPASADQRDANSSASKSPNASQSSSASPIDIPQSIPYRGPTDEITKSSCIVIAGFHKTIGSDGEIAKATHAMMSADKIKHALTPETNKNIKPEFHSTSNICGYYPLELSEVYSFRRYPQSKDEKMLFQQLKFQPTNTTSNFYHHFMAYALPVSSKDFRSARVIGAFRGIIPNSNLIPVQIQELHRVVFKSDPKIILFPNVIGTNIAGTHDAKILHETIIMVKSLHPTSTSDTLNKYKLNRGSIHNVFPVPLTFYGELAGMVSQLKTRSNISPPSSVVIRCAEATSSFNLMSVVDKLKSDSSLPWDDIAAILPMDFTSKSAKTIEVSYLSWHPVDHVVIVHKDGSDQRQLQQAITRHLASHDSYDTNTLVAKNERHLPGCLDRVFRKYARCHSSTTK